MSRGLSEGPGSPSIVNGTGLGWEGPCMVGSPQVNQFEQVQVVLTEGPAVNRQTRLKTLPSHNFVDRR